MDDVILRLHSEDWWVRENAASALGETRHPDAVAPLVAAAFQDPETSVQRKAKHALVELGSQAVPALLGYLEAPEREISLLAIQTLGKIGDTTALPPLVTLLQTSKEKEIRAGAIWALGQIGDLEALEPLIAALRDLDWHIVAMAAQMLGNLGDPRAIKPLQRLLHRWRMPFTMGLDEYTTLTIILDVLKKLGVETPMPWWLWWQIC